jgi:hypothetical protein
MAKMPRYACAALATEKSPVIQTPTVATGSSVVERTGDSRPRDITASRSQIE